MSAHPRGPEREVTVARCQLRRVKAPSLVAGVLLAAILAPACVARSGDKGPPPESGPPTVRPGVVQQRARWFDSNDPVRVAGSQQELVASSYLLARLQEAGYLVSLDPVPVGNLLHSTNVIALPPSGIAATVVIVDYDTSSSVSSDGVALGTFLEVARALRVVDPQHAVEFAALGAEHIAVRGGQVGARSLIELLKLQSPLPRIVRIGDLRQGPPNVSVAGPDAHSIQSVARRAQLVVQVAGSAPKDAFTAAGFAETVIDGNAAAGSVLLAFLGAGQNKGPAP